MLLIAPLLNNASGWILLVVKLMSRLNLLRILELTNEILSKQCI
jgi:hypothetical protein